MAKGYKVAGALAFLIIFVWVIKALMYPNGLTGPSPFDPGQRWGGGATDARAPAPATDAGAQDADVCRAMARMAREAAKVRDEGGSATGAKDAAASAIGAVDPETRALYEKAQGYIIDFAFGHPTMYPDDVAEATTRACQRGTFP